jgi:hypothetical protein
MVQPPLGPRSPWVENEFRDSRFADQRIRKRMCMFVQQLAEHFGQTIPLACQDWANTKAAYRLLDNSRVEEGEILAGHFQATATRAAAEKDLLLVLHDTTEFSYKREDQAAIGLLKGRRLPFRPTQYTTCGILLHSSLAVTLAGVPLGLCAAKFWTRERFKGTNALKRKINPTRIPIESKESIRWLENLRAATQVLGDADRCVHIGDRESDIFELFCAARDAGTHFVLRSCVDRLCGPGKQRVSRQMDLFPAQGQHVIRVHTECGKLREACLSIRYQRLLLRPPAGKAKRYAPVETTVIHAREEGPDSPSENAIHWKLVTDLPVTHLDQAVEKLEWYAQRWKIETYHKILKSGCRAEESRLRTASRLTNLLAIFCILSWRVFWLTMTARQDETPEAASVFTDEEIQLLDHLVPERSADQGKPALTRYLVKLARLGGYLARASDAPPGNLVLWRGLYRLNDVHLGFLAAKNCG